MTVITDTNGVPLPPIEAPSAEKLRVYGDMMFLAFRSPRHRAMPLGTLKTYIETPIELGQFRIFRFDDVPRAMYTWAFMNEAAERKLVEGIPLVPEDWNSGERLWIIDLIAPYRGLMKEIGRWIMRPGNLTDGEFLFRRVAGENDTRRVVHVNFRADSLARIYTGQQFLDRVA